MELGARTWVVPEGYLPTYSHGPKPELESHGTLCVLNPGSQDANLRITIYFHDRGPAGPFHARIPAERTRHLRLNELEGPEEIPRGVDFSSVLEADEPVVVQYTRLDSRQAENALMTTIAYAARA